MDADLAVPAVAALPSAVHALEPDPVEAPEEEALDDDEVDADEPDEVEEVEEAQVPAGAASERPLTAREVEEHDRRRLEELAQVGRRIVARVETFLAEEADEVEVDEQVLPWILRFAAGSIEARNRGNHPARHDGRMVGRPPKRPRPVFDPTHRAVTYRLRLGRSAEALAAEG